MVEHYVVIHVRSMQIAYDGTDVDLASEALEPGSVYGQCEERHAALMSAMKEAWRLKKNGYKHVELIPPEACQNRVVGYFQKLRSTGLKMANPRRMHGRPWAFWAFIATALSLGHYNVEVVAAKESRVGTVDEAVLGDVQHPVRVAIFEPADYEKQGLPLLNHRNLVSVQPTLVGVLSMEEYAERRGHGLLLKEASFESRRCILDSLLGRVGTIRYRGVVGNVSLHEAWTVSTVLNRKNAHYRLSTDEGLYRRDVEIYPRSPLISHVRSLSPHGPALKTRNNHQHEGKDRDERSIRPYPPFVRRFVVLWIGGVWMWPIIFCGLAFLDRGYRWLGWAICGCGLGIGGGSILLIWLTGFRWSWDWWL